MMSMHATAALRVVMLVAALLFAFNPAIGSAQQLAPAPDSPAPADGGAAPAINRHDATVLALAIGGIVLGSAALAVYYGPSAGAGAVAAFTAAHAVLDYVLVGAGVGAAYALWPWGGEPEPAAPVASGTAQLESDTAL
jgi:hypothetical protein